MRRPTRSPRLATLCLQGNTAASTKDNVTRTMILEKAVRFLLQQRAWHPIDALVLPGGFFWLSRSVGASTFERRRALISGERFIPAVTAALKQLQESSPGIRLITGVMAQPRDKTERTEQACLAFDRSGLIGAARKMFPTHAESRGRRYMTPFADDYRSSERFVDLPNGSLAALHSCYDLFGTADHGSDGSARRTAIKSFATKAVALGRAMRVSEPAATPASRPGPTLWPPRHLMCCWRPSMPSRGPGSTAIGNGTASPVPPPLMMAHSPSGLLIFWTACPGTALRSPPMESPSGS